jgi:hypothetical protein
MRENATPSNRWSYKMSGILTFFQRWLQRRISDSEAASMDPFDHPSLQSMDLRELADLPLDPPPAPLARPGGYPASKERIAVKPVAVTACRL